MARTRSSGKSRSASKSRRSKSSKPKKRPSASRARAPKKARPAARSKAKPRPGKSAAHRPAAAAKKKAPAARRTAGKSAAPLAERQGALDFEMEPGIPDLVIDRHLPPPPHPPKRRSGRGSHGSLADYPGESLTVGMEAPEFTLPSTMGRPVTLSEFRGKLVVLYFYPKDDTPGCTMEACAFRDSFPRIDAKGAVVLGISLDDELSHQRFVEKYNLNFPLLSDKDAAVSRKYGTYKEKSLYGRNFWGIERTTFVIDREGKVEHVFRRVKVEGHAEEVMATLAG
jgi:peroxiredoxin Q/BCP